MDSNNINNNASLNLFWKTANHCVPNYTYTVIKNSDLFKKWLFSQLHKAEPHVHQIPLDATFLIVILCVQIKCTLLDTGHKVIDLICENV